VSAAAGTSRSLQREWWLRALSIFPSPRAVLGALRDDSTEAAEARQEPVLVIVLLAGIAGVLSSSFAGRLLDPPRPRGVDDAVLRYIDSPLDAGDVAVWAFFGGGFYGLVLYWFGGLLVYALAQGIGARSSYRQARHVVGLAAAPIALTLVLVWPLRIAIYGEDVFRSGGPDTGPGDKLFEGMIVAGYVWALGLVALGLVELRKRSSSSSDIS
jgi:hypothetical protein